MQFSAINLTPGEIIIIVLMSVVLLILFVIALRLNKKFNELDFRSDEQARVGQALQDNFQQTRTALLEAQSNLQTKNEQRFGEVQQAIEKRLGEMSQASVGRFGEMQHSIEKRLGEMSKDSIASFAKSNNELHELLQKRLSDISGQVEQRLNQGFEKTTETSRRPGRRAQEK